VSAEKEGRVRRHRRDTVTHLGEKQRQLDEALAAPTDVLGQRDSEEIGCSELTPQCSVVTHLTGFELGEVFGGGPVLEQLTRDFRYRLLLFGEGEVHFGAAYRAGRNWCRTRSLPSMVSNVW